MRKNVLLARWLVACSYLLQLLWFWPVSFLSRFFVKGILQHLATLSKNKRGYDENAIPQHKRFRQNLADAYLAGQVTAARAASLFTDAWEASMLTDPSGESS